MCALDEDLEEEDGVVNTVKVGVNVELAAEFAPLQAGCGVLLEY